MSLEDGANGPAAVQAVEQVRDAERDSVAVGLVNATGQRSNTQSVTEKTAIRKPVSIIQYTNLSIFAVRYDVIATGHALNKFTFRPTSKEYTHGLVFVPLNSDDVPFSTLHT